MGPAASWEDERKCSIYSKAPNSSSRQLLGPRVDLIPSRPLCLYTEVGAKQRRHVLRDVGIHVGESEAFLITPPPTSMSEPPNQVAIERVDQDVQRGQGLVCLGTHITSTDGWRKERPGGRTHLLTNTQFYR